MRSRGRPRRGPYHAVPGWILTPGIFLHADEFEYRVAGEREQYFKIAKVMHLSVDDIDRMSRRVRIYYYLRSRVDEIRDFYLANAGMAFGENQKIPDAGEIIGTDFPRDFRTGLE